MKKKLQIYISSTFSDLVEERYTAVEAVRKAGHIPAGVELFFKETPMSIRKRWIDESDIYILILGGFYGLTLPDDESKSYTHWEYDYAGEVGKPRFAFVVTDEALRQKPYDFVVGEYYERLQEFKQSVFEEVPTYYVEDIRHIKMVMRDQLPEYERRDDLHGWISAKDVPDVQKLLEENASLLRENAKLQAELEKNKRENQ
ncbi:DUF4062 domain-containing protein [Paenibacillus sp. MER 180]|uniref:DUF4062 domain-containing protein n=1 Tax=Paenibacillus popilliae TaxID=78057 RepID=A0ABY3ANI0_PAEPP|nr:MULTISPECIES: DUF4062 domain-containing protein [unclassified Paenibacillus]MCM3288926.1 DUF4062 domain-containing protein [Paenibacillus sp. MER 180]OBY80351.1 hypothetical protein BBG47_06435 [Paenibacillus sp. KS1]TQR44044.1 DUF4062 domain-containing protein [Paenibacillus sp. SDF0028]